MVCRRAYFRNIDRNFNKNTLKLIIMYERELYAIKNKLESFKNWLELNYEACKTYGTDEEIGVFQDVSQKFNELFC